MSRKNTFRMLLGTLVLAFVATPPESQAAGLLNWTGAINGSWSLAGSDANWSGSGTAYSDGSAVTFPNSAAHTGITITSGGVQPSNVTFTNITTPYSFTGGAISGETGVTLSGLGGVTFSNSNTYTGATTVSGGTLQIGTGGATGAIGPGSITNNATLVFSRSDSIDLVSTNTVSGSGALIANAGTAGTIGIRGAVNQGSVALTSGNPNSVLNVYGSNYGAGINLFADVSTTGNQSYNGVVSIGRGGAANPITNLTTSGGGSVTLGGGVVSGVSGYWSAGTLNIDTSAGNGPVALGGTIAFLPFGVGNLNVNSGTAATTLTGGSYYYDYSVFSSNVALSGNAAFQCLGYQWVRGLQFNGSLTSAGADTYGLTASFGSGAGATSGSGANGLVFNVASTATAAVPIAGTAGLTKIGPGTLIVTGSNTYSGTTTISAGTLQLGDGTAGHDGSIAGGIVNNAALVYNLNGSQICPAAISGSGSLTKTGNGTLALAVPSTYSGPTVIAGGTLKLLGIGVVGTATFTSDATSGINSANSYTEALAFAQGNSLGINGVTFANANNTGGLGNLGSSWTINIAGNTTSGSFPGGFQPASGQGTYSLLNHFYYEGNATPVTLTLAGLTPGQTYDARIYYREWSTNDNRVADFTFNNGVSTQTATVNEDVDANGHYIDYPYTAGPNGTVTISETNDASMLVGGSWHWYGFSNQLIATNVNLLPTATALSVGGGSALDLNGVSQQVASLSGAGTVTSSNTAAACVLTLSPTGGSTAFSGTIQGGGILGTISLVKSGSGTQVLSGSNTYAGPTTINQGKLVVDGSLLSLVTVNSGGILGGTGSLTSVTVSAGGQVAPGDSPGVLQLSGNLVLASGAEMDYFLDTPSTSDEITCGSLGLNLQQFADFNFTWSSNFAPGSYPLIYFGSSSGSLGAITSGTVDGYPATLAVQGNDLVLNVTPEPSTLALLAAGAIGLIAYGLRRRAARIRKPTVFDQQDDAPRILSFPSDSSRPVNAARRVA